jgi:hypothetical protein
MALSFASKYIEFSDEQTVDVKFPNDFHLGNEMEIKFPCDNHKKIKKNIPYIDSLAEDMAQLSIYKKNTQEKNAQELNKNISQEFDNIDTIYFYSGEKYDLVPKNSAKNSIVTSEIEKVKETLETNQEKIVCLTFLCSSEIEKTFCAKKSLIIECIELALFFGATVNVADYALAGLISIWPKERWGVPPLESSGTCNRFMRAGYVRNTLLECDNIQLRELAIINKDDDNGESFIKIHTLENTRLFNLINTETENYIAFPLTVAIEYDTKNIKKDKEKENDKEKICTCLSSNLSGKVAHTIVRFKNYSGNLVLSSPHFCELNKIENLDEEEFMKLYFDKYGMIPEGDIHEFSKDYIFCSPSSACKI